MKTVFLDFDGVLFDTVLESYLLSRFAFEGIEPQEKINNKEYELFHYARFLITHSWHYYYIMITIKNKVLPVNFEQEYNKLLLNRDIKEDSNFDKIFQVKRKDLIKNYYEFWNKLDKPYNFFYKIKDLQSKYLFIIVSTKNEEAIFQHCKDYGLNIENHNILGKTKLKQYGNKKNFLEQYIQKNNIENSIFIDDSLKTIQKCANIPNLKVMCANWGYVASKKDGYSEAEILKAIKEI